MLVRQLVGRNAGEIVDLPYAVATACLSNGTVCPADAEPPRVRGAELALSVQPELPQPSPAPFTARHAGSGRWRVFDAADKPVTDAMDKAAAVAEAKRLNAGQGV